MIHLRAIWYANGSKRAIAMESRIRLEESKRRINSDLQISLKDFDEKFIAPALNAFVADMLSKREARLIQKQNYVQTGGS
jgi:uncharacterized protein (DUF1786 family)